MQIKRCKGFLFGAVASGLKKKSGAKDLGLIYSETSANAAGVFTRNKIKAAPVILDQERLEVGTCQALIVNSGNANCCNGPKGMADALTMTKEAADALRISTDRVLAASTGVIGQPLPVDKIRDAVPDLVKSLNPDGMADFAESIMTTDTRPKVVAETGGDSALYSIIGCANMFIREIGCYNP